MNTTKVIPDSHEHWLEMRSKVLTSTEISVLFDLNKYQTRYELFLSKSGQLDIPFEESERMKWGTRLEQSIAEGAAQENGWAIRPMEEFIYDEELRIGSSFDFCIREEFVPDPHGIHADKAILEVKNVDSLIYYNEWTEWEAPPHIELQVQHQMLLTGLKEAYIVALVGGNELKIIHRKANEKIHDRILDAAKDFWITIDNNTPPEPDFDQDSSLICELYKNSDGTTFDATDNEKIYDLATRYKQAMADEKDAYARKRAIKAEVLTLVGKAEKVYGAGFSISCKETKDSEVPAFTRKGHRGFRVTWKKEKV